MILRNKENQTSRPVAAAQSERRSRFAADFWGSRDVAVTLIAPERHRLVPDWAAALADQRVDVAQAVGNCLPDGRFLLAIKGVVPRDLTARKLARALGRAEPAGIGTVVIRGNDTEWLDIATAPSIGRRLLNWLNPGRTDVGLVVCGFGTKREWDSTRRWIAKASQRPIVEQALLVGDVTAGFFRFSGVRADELSALAYSINVAIPTMVATVSPLPAVPEQRVVISRWAFVRMDYWIDDFIGALGVVTNRIQKRGGTIYHIEAETCQLSHSGAIDGFHVTVLLHAPDVLNRRDAEARFAPEASAERRIDWDAELGWGGDDSKWKA